MSLEARVEALEAKVEALEGERPGRKALQILVSEKGVCGVDPESDSTTCPHGTLHRRRMGCLGDACQRAAREYYNNYRTARVVAPSKRRR